MTASFWKEKSTDNVSTIDVWVKNVAIDHTALTAIFPMFFAYDVPTLTIWAIFCSNWFCTPATTVGSPKEFNIPVLMLHGSQLMSSMIPVKDLVVSSSWKFEILPIKIVMISDIWPRMNGIIKTIAHRKTSSSNIYAIIMDIGLCFIFFWKKSITASIAREMIYAIKIR